MRRFMWTFEMPPSSEASPAATESQRAGKILQPPAQAGPRLKYLLARCLALLFFSALICAKPLFSVDDGRYKIVEIKPHVFVYQAEDILEQAGDPNFSRASNAGFVITPQGVVVINTTNTPFNARAMLYEIRQRTSLPVRYVINTSALPDAMLGNEAFEDFRPTILATPAAADLMHRYRNHLPERLETDWRLALNMRGIHPTPAGQTFGQTMTLPVSNPQIRLISLGKNASPGDAAVYLPQSKVVFLGDVFENQFVPQMDGGDIHHWIRMLSKVASWDAEVFVPGHGAPGGRDRVEQFRRFLEWVLTQVQTRLAQHKTELQVQEELVPFQAYQWHAPELQEKLVAAIYRQLAAAARQEAHSAKPSRP